MTLELPFVMEFVVYLTNRCNLRCEMCSQYGENFKENSCPDMTFEQWKPFFDSISDVNPKPKVILMGGEPFLHKEIDKIIEYLNDKELYIHIVTNGVFIGEHLDIISKCKNISITISLDGLGELHDKIRRVKGTFDRAIKNIRRLSELRKENKNITVLINSVLLPDNIDDIDKFVKQMQKEDIDQIVFQHLQFTSSELIKKTKQEWKSCLNQDFNTNFYTQKQYKIDKNYTNKLKNISQKLHNICKVETFIFPYLHNEEIDKYYFDKDLKTIRPYQRCTTPWLTAFISSDGTVSNCIENSLGNIKEADFWEIWNNEKANKFRETLCKNGNFSVCAKCCNFYKNTFLYAKDGKVNIDGKEYILPNELNFLVQSKDVALILDKSNSTETELYAYPIEIHSDKMLEEIKKQETIVYLYGKQEQ